jgi:hypothetical protein
LQFYYHQPERGTIFTSSGMTVLTFSLLWIITSLIFPNGQGSYFEQLKELTFGIFKKGLSDYFYLFGTFFGVSPIWTGIYYILVAFFLIGAWVRRQTDQPLIIFYILYLTAILFWPEWQGIRFIFPLLPIFVYFVFQGLKTVIEKLPKKFQRIGASLSYTFWFIIIGIFLFNSSLGAYANLKNNRQINGPFDSYSMEVYNFIQTKTPTHSIIVFYKPRAMRLFTNHSTLMSTECDRLTLGNYVVISKKAENSQIPPDQIDECGLRLKDVFENRRFIIYQVPK